MLNFKEYFSKLNTTGRACQKVWKPEIPVGFKKSAPKPKFNDIIRKAKNNL